MSGDKEQPGDASPEGAEPPRRLPPFDPSRPLRMPGESLRSVEAPGALAMVSALSDFFRRLWAKLSHRPAAQPETTAVAASASAPRRPSGLMLAVGGLVVFAIAMIAVVPFYLEGDPSSATPPETTQAVAPLPSVAASALASADAGAPERGDAGPPPPKVFRVRSLTEDPTLQVVEGSVGKRTVIAALVSSGLLVRDAYRALHAFKGQKVFDKPHAGDSFVYAKRRIGGDLVAFEYIVPPFDVWQARLDEATHTLEAKKVVFTPEARRVTRAVLVGDDLKKSLLQAELDDDMLGMLDDALDGHAELVDMRPGARLRIVAEEERIEGVFARYSHVDAVEYTPANPKAKRVRVYRFDESGQVTRKRSHQFYDEHGRQPYKGGFRSPVPLGRITSRFNPRRMHPVLRVIMPHNGVDFAAPPGTPIYATSSGVVRSAAMAGPNGNMVQVAHSNGLVSAYCHLSRFAAGLRPGAHVEARQLVGYVGTTGRSTGPHLHFAIKRGETFLDPLSLRLDGMKTLGAEYRDAFDKARTELDRTLDGILLPDAPESASAASSDDIIYDELPDGGAPDAEVGDAGASAATAAAVH